MSNAWISATAFKGSVGKAIPVRNGVEWFEGFWDRFWWVFVKGFHVGEFLILALLFNRALSKANELPPRKSIPAAGFLAGFFAMIDEYHQSFVSYRGGRWTDVFIDWGGVITALVIVVWLNYRKTKALARRDLR